jgi:heme exporter protein B
MTSDSLTRAFALLLKRDLVLAVRHRGEMLNPLLFFVLVTSLFPLGIGAYPELLEAVGPGIIWVAALLAALLSLDGIFRSDFEDGTLEQLLLSSHPVSVLVLAKVLEHWLVTGMRILLLTLLLGTPVLSLLGAVGVALTVGLRKGGMILSLLVLPLYVPLLIFGANAVDTAAAGLPVTAHLSLISALLVLALSLSPLATAAALRISLS